MKLFYYLLIPVLFTGCKPAATTTYTVKPMPESEIAFIKKVKAIDSVFDSRKNEITKKEYLEKGKKEMEAYILKNLDVKDWVVKVNDIEVDSTAIAYIKVTMFVPVGNWREEKYPDLNFPVFTALLADKNGKLKDQIKVLEKMDEVYISGKIIKNFSGGINVADFHALHDDNSTFYNIALDFHLTDIKKTH